MSNSVGVMSSSLVLEDLFADFRLLLSGEGFAVLTEGLVGDDFDKLDVAYDYVGSLVDAIRVGVGEGVLSARVSGSYGRVPESVCVRLVVFLRSHGVQLRRAHRRSSEDLLYWGSKQMK